MHRDHSLLHRSRQAPGRSPRHDARAELWFQTRTGMAPTFSHLDRYEFHQNSIYENSINNVSPPQAPPSRTRGRENSAGR